jgi:hypothetical protein
LSLAGNRSIEGVELSLTESFVLSDEGTTVAQPKSASSVSTTSGGASEDGNRSGAEASSRSTAEDSSEFSTKTDQSEDDESQPAKSSSPSETFGASSENINVILIPRSEVESRFVLAEKKSSQYTSNVLNLPPSGKSPSLRNLQSSLEVMRNIIVNSN